MDKYIKILWTYVLALILTHNSFACYTDWEDDSYDGGWICDYDDIICTPDDNWSDNDDDWDDWWDNNENND